MRLKPSMLTLADLTDQELQGQKILVRVDLNVPMKNGVILSKARMESIQQTLDFLMQKQASVLLISHWGRPQEGHFDPHFSLEPVADALRAMFQYPLVFQPDIFSCPFEKSTLYLGENLRFLSGESSNDPRLSRRLADLADVFVMDAFAVAHRKQASTHGVIQAAKIACAGFSLMQEWTHLEHCLHSPRRPLMAVLGGAKISTKLPVLLHLLDCNVDALLLAGGLANTLLKAKGFQIGQSLYEAECLDTAMALLQRAEEKKIPLCLPIDFKGESDRILDLGPKTLEHYATVLKPAQTILWNGPLGYFEEPDYAQGTLAMARLLADHPAYTVAGGGETLAAIEQTGAAHCFDHLSTAGGAFLTYLAGNPLPSIEALQQKTV